MMQYVLFIMFMLIIIIFLKILSSNYNIVYFYEYLFNYFEININNYVLFYIFMVNFIEIFLF